MRGYERHLAPTSAGSGDDQLWVLRERESQMRPWYWQANECFFPPFPESRLYEEDEVWEENKLFFGHVEVRGLWDIVDMISSRKLEKQFWNLEMKSGMLI